MSSFQQVMMGGICLVAAFWFGSQIHEHPAGLQQPLQGLSNATAGVLDGQVNGQQVQSQLAAKTKGFFNSLFEAPAKPQPVTLSDLKSRATSGFANATSQNPGGSFVPNQGFGLPKQVVETATEVVSDFAKPPFPNLGNDRSFVADNQIADRNYSAENNHVDQQRLEIVPNFSTLVEDVRRTRAEQSRPIEHFVEAADTSGQHNSMLPVPKMDEFSRTSFGQATFEQPTRDWNVVKQGVTSVEAKLKQFRSAHPVAEEFKPVHAFDSTALTATNKTSGRFIPEATSAQPESEHQQTREPWLDRTTKTFVPNNTSCLLYTSDAADE